jgi:hypothetical protein
MTLPPEKRLKFFVYIIESPSAPDLYHKRSEGDLLRQAINLDGILCVSRYAVIKEAFEAAIKIGLHEVMEIHPNLIPILHISAHGFSEGIQLSNKEIVTWAELKELLKPLNKALQGYLIVCMSCCMGYAGTRMAMFTEDTDLPYFAIIGNGASPNWSDTAVAYATFYHLIAKGETVIDAVKAMCISSGDNQFYVETAKETRKSFIEYIQKLNANTVKEELRNDVRKEPPSNLAKLTKLEGK